MGTVEHCAGQLTESGIILVKQRLGGHSGIEVSSKLSSTALAVPVPHIGRAPCAPSTIQSTSVPSCSAARLTHGDVNEWREGHRETGLQGSAPGLQDWSSVSTPSAAQEPADLPVILAASSTFAPPPFSPVPAQAGGFNGLLALSPSSLLKYLLNHYVFSVQAWGGEEAGGSSGSGQMQGLITDGTNPPDLKIKPTSKRGKRTVTYMLASAEQRPWVLGVFCCPPSSKFFLFASPTCPPVDYPSPKPASNYKLCLGFLLLKQPKCGETCALLQPESTSAS